MPAKLMRLPVICSLAEPSCGVDLKLWLRVSATQR